MVKLSRIALIGLLVPACAYTDPGSGTNTLQTSMQLVYAPSTDTMEITSSFQKNSLAANASVEIKDTDKNLPFYNQASIQGYRRHLQIQVDSTNGTQTTDGLNCSIEGPGPHTLSNPLQNAQLSAGDDLEVQWQTEDGLFADQIVISLQRAGYTSPIQTSDSGSFTIHSSSLVKGIETVTVQRTNTVTPAGGAPPSTVSLSYQASVTFTLQ